MTANDNRPEPKRNPGRSSSRANIAAFIVVVVVAATLFWVVSAMRQHNAMQDCLDSGRHDCGDADSH